VSPQDEKNGSSEPEATRSIYTIPAVLAEKIHVNAPIRFYQQKQGPWRVSAMTRLRQKWAQI
jgi:hypothetical protein